MSSLPPLTRRKFLKAAAVLGAGLLAPGLAPRPARAAGTPRIVVVGAGFAGLTTAYRLQTRYRLPCTVYEARDRVGGRVATIRGLDGGQWAERGAQFVSSGDSRLRRLIRDLGLGLIDLDRVTPTYPVRYRFGGNFVAPAALEADLKVVAAAAWDDYDTVVPAATWATADHATKVLDAMSVEEWLSTRCPGGLSSTVAQYLKVYFETEYGGPIADASALHMVYEFGLPGGNYDERYTIDGGNDQVATAIEAALAPGTIVKEAALRRAADAAGGSVALEFDTASGTLAVEADLLVLALPFPTLRDVDLLGLTLDPRHRSAIDNLGMGTNRKLNLQFASTVWEPAGGGESYSDLVTGGTWPTHPGMPGSQGLLTAFPASSPAALYDGSAAHGPASAPVLAAHLAALDLLFPGTSAAHNGFAELDNWPADPWSKGSYAYYRQGQFAAFAGIEGKTEGNVFFAGEHTAPYRLRGTMNGAVDSGERVAKALRRAAKAFA